MRRELCEKEKCLACGACVNICPQDALSLTFEGIGFYHVEVDEDRCIDCGRCAEVCPQLKERPLDNRGEPPCLAYMAPDEIRVNNSSGGVFTVLAEYVISQGGVVFGCTYDEHLIPHQIAASTMEELAPLKKSKYTQTAVGYSFREVKEVLKTGKLVLYTGTPCLIAGLRSYLKRPYENLYTVDLLCSGTAPIGLYARYLEELKVRYGKNITWVDFRHKDMGWNCGHLTVSFDDGTVVAEKWDAYMQAFIRGLFRRQACNNCRWAEFPRPGDITMGDFWNIEKYNLSFSDGKGTSLVTLNSEKGEKLFHSSVARVEAKLMEPVPFEFTRHSNWFTSERPATPEMYHVYDLMEKHSVEESVRRVLNRIYDVCIIGNWSGYNYGAHLTHYALYRTLTDHGYDVLMLEKPDQEPYRPLPKADLFKVNPYAPYALSPLFLNLSSMRELNQRVSTFVVGSDQLWNWNLFGHSMEFYALEFVSAAKNKVSYATSFATNRLQMPEDKARLLRLLLQRFNAISVRERSGVDICREHMDVTAEWVLDPVFLCDPKVYEEMAERADAALPGKYVFAYILDSDEFTHMLLEKIAQYYSCDVICVGNALHNEANDQIGHIRYISREKVEEWLACLLHAEYVVANSFHAYAFSLIFQKQILPVYKTRQGAERVFSLSNLIHTPQPLIISELGDNWTADELCQEHRINYEEVNALLSKERQRCLSWLLNAIDHPRPVPSNNEDTEREFLVSCLAQTHTEDHGKMEAAFLHTQEKKLRSEIFQLRESIEQKNRESDRLHAIMEQQQEGLQQQQAEIEKREETIRKQKKRINTLVNSKTFRTGKAVLYVPKKVYKLIK